MKNQSSSTESQSSGTPETTTSSQTNLLQTYIQSHESQKPSQPTEEVAHTGKHDASGHCQQVVYVPAHTRQGHPVSAYDRLCGQKHTAKEAAEKNQEESIQENVNRSSWDQLITTKENQYLLFDGKKLTLYENGNLEKSWNAVSGKTGFQHPNYQDLKNYGPIPEGNYVARKDEHQKWEELSLLQKTSAYVGKGEWPGGTYAWGENRIWLTPSLETNTYNRDNFSIHGGKTPGSSGCIDLTKDIQNFTQWFEKNGFDVIVHVKY